MFLAEDRILCIEVVAKKVGGAESEAGGPGPALAPFFFFAFWGGSTAALGPWPGQLHCIAIPASLLPSDANLSLPPPPHPTPPARQGAAYRLEYIQEAVAEADAVTKLTGLMKQRRRWLNGTFFAMLYALGNMGRIWTESSHSVGRKLALTMEFMYLIVNLVVGTW